MSIFFTGCNSTQKQIQTKGGLKINGWSSALGSVNETDLDKTKFSYSVNITNENENIIFIKSIQPSINKKIIRKIISKDIIVTVNKDVKPNETTQINGEIIVDTKGLTKSDILKLEPFITDVKVSTEETISLKQ
jgi:hypothetical protein